MRANGELRRATLSSGGPDSKAIWVFILLFFSLPLLFARVSAMSFHVHSRCRSNSFPVARFHAATCVKLSSAQNWCNVPLRVEARSSGTSLCGDDSNVMPLLLFPIQFHRRGDETIVRSDTEQRLRVWLGINWVPEKKWTGIKRRRADRLEDIKEPVHQ